MPLEDINKKWTYLKKEYKKHKQQLNKYVKSGCSLEEAVSITGKPLWKHYKSLMFIDDITDDVITVSNVAYKPVVDGPSTSSSSSTSVFSPQPSTDVHDQPKPKKQKLSTMESNSSEKLLDNLIAYELNKPKLDSTDHFCGLLALEMKKLDNRKRAELQIQFLTLLNNALYSE